MPAPLYDWPIVPTRAVVHAPKSLITGAIASSGFESNTCSMGVRNRVEMEFDSRESVEDGRMFSWLLQQAGTYFRVPVYNTPQLVGFPDCIPGVPFSGGATFSGGVQFAGSMTMDTAATALAGENIIQIDTSRYSQQLQHGHVFNIGFRTYHVDEVSYSDSIATVTTAQPLKRDIAVGEFVDLRPKVICKTNDMSSFRALFDPEKVFRPGSILLTEVFDNDYL